MVLLLKLGHSWVKMLALLYYYFFILFYQSVESHFRLSVFTFQTKKFMPQKHVKKEAYFITDHFIDP